MIFVREAYGRQYTTETEVRKAWEDNKDFQVMGESTYLNKADAFKYANLDMVYFVKPNQPDILLKEGVF